MKNTMLKKIAVGSILAISTCLATVGQANAAPYNTTNYIRSVDNGPLSQLNLTNRQISQIKAIQNSNYNKGKNGYKNTHASILKVLTTSQRNKLERIKAENKAKRGYQNKHSQNQNHKYNQNHYR